MSVGRVMARIHGRLGSPSRPFVISSRKTRKNDADGEHWEVRI